ncbi:MAG: hypothetical protein IKJ13_06710 [Clostridia bacterium]|nr:hypothetical protein [Clostridia bacterium]
MEYKKIRDTFFHSTFVSEIPDNWKEGLPFLKISDNKIFDVVLFYTEDSKNFVFHEVKAVYTIDSKNGEIYPISKEGLAKRYQFDKEFSFEPISNNAQVSEVKSQKNELIEKYEIVRSALIAGAAVDTAIYRRYNELFRLLVPAQIIEKIYTPLITK